MHTPATNLSGDPVPVPYVLLLCVRMMISTAGWGRNRNHQYAMEEGNHLGNSRPSVLAPALDIKSTALN